MSRKRKTSMMATIAAIILAAIATSFTWLKDRLFPPAADQCTVTNIYDGDTLTVQCPNNPEKTKVRMYCIDTPEIKQTPWGIQARDHLRSIAGNTVKIVEINKDRYGRTVGEVYAGTVNLNVAQVAAGYAAVYVDYCKKPAEYKAAEMQAQTEKRGIWAKPGIQQTPWEWRKQQRQDEN